MFVSVVIRLFTVMNMHLLNKKFYQDLWTTVSNYLLLKVKPEERPTAAEALSDPWFNIEPIDNE
ncbi:hypothetical protein RMATCC62417_09610 [Rhizopus microsporus]|nr:hypothetical protein RMATCC62417_09610 [Rhizopus microsporus]